LLLVFNGGVGFGLYIAAKLRLIDACAMAASVGVLRALLDIDTVIAVHISCDAEQALDRCWRCRWW